MGLAPKQRDRFPIQEHFVRRFGACPLSRSAQRVIQTTRE